eukprot:4610278-Pyramimonas_sp.AAC.1
MAATLARETAKREAPISEWVLHDEGFWMCELCRVRARSEAARVRRDTQTCPGHYASLSALAEQRHGHDIYVFDRLENDSCVLACVLPQGV